MIDLPGPSLAILGALASAPTAWLSPGEIAGLVGVPVEETTDRLASLDEQGWVEVWERPEGIVVTLSPLSASRLALKLVEIGRDEIPRWAPSGDPEPPSPRAKNVCGAARSADLEFVVDPQEAPEAALERSESYALRSRDPRPSPARRPPRPTLVVGQGVNPWREVHPGPACPGCGGYPLKSDAYCLCCGRWGLDSPAIDPMPPRRSSRPPRPSVRFDPCRAEQAIRAERLRRKSRRSSILEARAAAEASRKSGPPGASKRARHGPLSPAGREVRAAAASPS